MAIFNSYVSLPEGKCNYAEAPQCSSSKVVEHEFFPWTPLTLLWLGTTGDEKCLRFSMSKTFFGYSQQCRNRGENWEVQRTVWKIAESSVTRSPADLRKECCRIWGLALLGASSPDAKRNGLKVCMTSGWIWDDMRWYEMVHDKDFWPKLPDSWQRCPTLIAGTPAANETPMSA